MARETINNGTIAGDGTGEPLFDAFEKVNNNFNETYIDNRIVVKQASDFGVIDSTKQYFLDGIIDMGTTSIEVPSGGISIQGINSEISGLISTESSYAMFTSDFGGSGNFLATDVFFTTSGTASKVYVLTADTGSEAHEVSRVNYTDCSSLGELTGYRQGLETETGRFGGQPALSLAGTWSGGFFIDTSIVRDLVDGAYAIYEEGTSFTMASRFRSNANIDLNTNVEFISFQVSNFANPNTLQLESCFITRNGVVDASDTNIIPNINQTQLPSLWRSNVGIPNTFIGGEAVITVETTTTISVAGTFVDLAGTYVASDMQHFSSPSNGQLLHLGNSPREYKIIISAVLDCNSNDEVDLKIVVWDDSASGFVDYKSIRRVINNLQGGRDVAYFNFSDNIILDEHDFVKLQTANVGATNNITAELDTQFTVEER